MTQEASPLGLGDYLGMIRRLWWLVVLLVLAAVAGAAFWVSRQSDVYEARAVVLLRTGSNTQLFPAIGNNFGAFTRLPSSELEFVQSDAFRSAAPTGTSVRASVPETSNQLVFTATAANPGQARDAANAWAETYVTVRHQRDITENAAAREDAEATLELLEADRDLILAPLEPLDEALARETDSESITLLTTQRLALQQSLSDELLPVENEIRTINAELTQLRSVERFLDREDVSAVVSRQATGGRQIAPQPLRDITLAGVLGLFTALAAVILVDTARNRVVGRDDLARVRPSIPVLAEIPRVKERRRDEPQAFALPPAAREGIERLLTAIGLSARTDGLRVVLITSVQESEGKTSTSLALASRAAEQGLRVLLIDADLRRPRVHSMIGSNRSPGVGDLAVDPETAPEEVITGVELPSGATFDVVTAGPVIDHPAGFLRSGDLGKFVRQVYNSYQLILLDSPPVQPVSDTEILAEVAADAVVVLSRVGRTRRDDLQQTMSKLDGLDVQLLGHVLVGTAKKSSYYQTEESSS